MSEESKRAQKIFDDLATGFACLQVQFGINMTKAVHLLNDLALLFDALEKKVNSNELTGGSAAENPAKEGQELPPAPADKKADPTEETEEKHEPDECA